MIGKKYQGRRKQGQRMSDSSIKKRIQRALETAILGVKRKGHDFALSDHNPFDLIAVKKRKIRFIRIALDKIEVQDLASVQSFAADSKIISREIWLRKRGQRRFEILRILKSTSKTPGFYSRKCADFQIQKNHALE